MKLFRNTAIKFALVAVLIGTAGYATYFYYRYRGFVLFLGNQLRYATWNENKNSLLFLTYWLGFMQKLTLNENTGVYGFEGAAQQPMDDFEAGKLAYHLGNFPKAITLMEKDIKNTRESESKLFWLAMSYLRNGEAQNCLAKLRPDTNATTAAAAHDSASHESEAHDFQQMCSLPLVRFHEKPENSRAAGKLFERLLDTYDQKNDLYQWLLNFSYMTINAFPQEVPAKYLIKTKFIDTFYGEWRRRAQEEFRDLSFADRAKELGVDTYGTGRGVAVEDFDKDGYLDIVTGGQFEAVRYYKNDHGVRFVDMTSQAGLTGVTQPFIINAADYDNDGWPDLFVARPFGRFQLFHNNQNGTFTDVTASSGLLSGMPHEEVSNTLISSWADINNDGYLDLFLGQVSLRLPFVTGLLSRPAVDSKLFLNEHGHFVDRTSQYGLAEIMKDRIYMGAAFGDYNSDGYPDLFLSSLVPTTSVLLRNVGGKRFEKTTLIPPSRTGFTAAFLDVNHDGKLDIFQGGIGDARTATQMAVFGKDLDKNHVGRSAILLQTADGRFAEHDEFFDLPIGTMGTSFGDIDNDGCYDFYLGTGDPEGWFILPNLMYRGESEGTKCVVRTKNISMLEGFGTVQKGHGIVFFDFNNDGKQDIYSRLGGMWPADRWPSQFFVNNSKNSNRWVDIRLRGRKTNYFGVGCSIKVTAENQKGESIVRFSLMSNGTGFGSAPYLAHVGLMDAIRISKVEVFWPVSRRWKTYDAQLNNLNTLDEGE
jgi:hypothetical protein